VIIVFVLTEIRKLWMTHLSTLQPEIVLVAGVMKELELQLARSERNVLLGGSTIFLFLALFRFQSMMTKIQHLKSRTKERILKESVPTDILDVSNLETVHSPVPRKTLHRATELSEDI